MHNQCVICDSQSFPLKTVGEYNIRKCGECALEFVWPMPLPSDLGAFYSTYSCPNDEVVKRNAIQNLGFLQVTRQDSVLDYGCGEDIFSDICRENGILESFGYDPYFGRAKPSLRKWNLITMWGVLEHLTNPVDKLMRLKSMLSESGRIALTTININSKIPFRYKPPEHTLYFTEQSLRKLFDVVGLKVLSFEDYVMIQDSSVYLETLLRTMPEEYKKCIFNTLPEFVEVPTNEVRIIVGES